ncbi:MAG: FlaD/FlaE family flagellar protein [Candidatus Thermoplasmatota archaeon]
MEKENTNDKDKSKSDLKSRAQSKKKKSDEEDIKSIGKEDWTFDGKKGYEKRKGADLRTYRKKKSVDDITSGRKEDVVDEIAGEGADEEYRAERLQNQTVERTESPPPPRPEPKEGEEKEREEEDEEVKDEEIPPDQLNKFEIRHGMPEVKGETAEDPNRRDRFRKEDRSLPEDRKATGSVDSELVKDLKEHVADLSDKVDAFSEELNDIDEEISLLISRMDRLEKREVNYEKVEEKLKELSALYDVLSSDVSPFIELGELAQPPGKEGTESPATMNNLNHLNQPNRMKNSEQTPSREEETNKKAQIDISERYDMEAMIDWIDFLYTKTGGNIQDALDYYLELGWIGQELKDNILTYTEGMKLDVREDSDMIIGEDGDVERNRGDWKLSPEDHKESLRYIEAIKRGDEKNKKERDAEKDQDIESFERGEN